MLFVKFSLGERKKNTFFLFCLVTFQKKHTQKRFLTALRPRHLLTLSRWPLMLYQYGFPLQAHCDAAQEKTV
jgi:hypothetical protein